MKYFWDFECGKNDNVIFCWFFCKTIYEYVRNLFINLWANTSESVTIILESGHKFYFIRKYVLEFWVIFNFDPKIIKTGIEINWHKILI